MTKNGKIMTCITGRTIRNIVEQANELEITKDDIVSMFVLGEHIYLIYYR